MKTLLHHSYSDLKSLMEQPEECQRLRYHLGLPNFSVIECDTVSEKKWFAHNAYTFGFNKKLFYRKISTSGFTYEKKKVSVWFGLNIKKVLALPNIGTFFKNLGHEWFSQLLESASAVQYRNLLTKTMIERILNNKITNIEELLQYWIKYSIKDKRVDSTLLKFAMKTTHFNPMDFKYQCKVLKSPNEYLSHISLGQTNFYKLGTIFSCAHILAETVDITFESAEIVQKEKELLEKVDRLKKKYGFNTKSKLEF